MKELNILITNKIKGTCSCKPATYHIYTLKLIEGVIIDNSNAILRLAQNLYIYLKAL